MVFRMFLAFLIYQSDHFAKAIDFALAIAFVLCKKNPRKKTKFSKFSYFSNIWYFFERFFPQHN